MSCEKENEIKICSIEELSSLLARAYWVEAQLEQAMQWEAYMTVKEKFREPLFRISHDSEKHKTIVKKICENIKGLDLEKTLKESGLSKREFDFKGKWDEEIINELLKNEHLVKDTYTKLYEHTDRNFIEKHWNDDNPDSYFKKLNWLINQEKQHVEILTPFVGKIERIL
jgi:hypothetical protein